jgi:hypothetical protein
MGTPTTQPDLTPNLRIWLILVTSFVFVITLAACAPIHPDGPAAITTTPVSTKIDRFRWQTDDRYGYRMLRPTSWEEIDLGAARG